MWHVHSVQAAIEAAEKGALAIYWDWCVGVPYSSYCVIETREELAELSSLLNVRVDNTLSRERLRRLTGWGCWPGFIEALFVEGEWRRDPNELLEREKEARKKLEEQWASLHLSWEGVLEELID